MHLGGTLLNRGRGAKKKKRAALAGLGYAAVRHHLSPIARAAATVLENLSWAKTHLPVIMVGYGGVADGKKRPDGLAEATHRCRRSAMRGVRELERAGLVKIGGETRERTAYGGRRKWWQRIGGRLEGGPGRANEYGPGQHLGGSAPRPRPAPPTGDEETPEQLKASAANKRGLAQVLLESASKLEARAGP